MYDGEREIVAMIRRLALAFFLLSHGLNSPVLAADGAIEISQAGLSSLPYVISQPGRYVLTSDLRIASFGTTAIRIDVDDVTLDLNGFSVYFAFSGGPVATGIDASNRNRVTVMNGTVRGFTGSCVSADDFAVVSNLRVLDCGGDGLALGQSARVSDVTARGNGGVGIAARVSGFDSGASVITRSISTENGGDGIEASGTILDNVVQDNGGDGIEGEGGDAVIRGNTIVDNTGVGIRSNFGTCTAGEAYAYSQNLISSNLGGTVVGDCIQEIGENVCNTNTTCP